MKSLHKLSALMLALLMLLSALASCKPAPDPEPEDMTTGMVTDVSTEPATEPQPDSLPVLDLAAHTLTVENDAVALTFSCKVESELFEGELICTLASDADGQICKQRLAASTTDYQISLPCSAEQSKGELTVTVMAVTADGQMVDALHLTTKNGYVQLPRMR